MPLFDTQISANPAFLNRNLPRGWGMKGKHTTLPPWDGGGGLLGWFVGIFFGVGYGGGLREWVAGMVLGVVCGVITTRTNISTFLI